MVFMFALFAVFLIPQALAHFVLQYPPNIGFDDDNETNSPCGGFTPDFTKDTITDFHVGGDSIAVLGAHPEITYIFRATLAQDAASGWEPMTATDIQIVGLNLACNPSVPAPAAFAGNKGIIQVIADSPDGILFQCAAVNFITGTAEGLATGCQNSSGIAMAYSSDVSLDGPYRSTTEANVVASGTGTGTATSFETFSATPFIPSPTPTISGPSRSTTIGLRVGVGLGVSLGVILLLSCFSGFLLWRKRHKRSEVVPPDPTTFFDKPELPAPVPLAPVLSEKEIASKPKMPLERHMLDSKAIQQPVEMEGRSGINSVQQPVEIDDGRSRRINSEQQPVEIDDGRSRINSAKLAIEIDGTGRTS